ncbi:MAG: MarR family transcriptional regulator [Planctomycetota bacterium]
MSTNQPTEAGDQITAGLFKLALVLRHQAWQSSGQRGLTPTQSQILALVGALEPGVSVSFIAKHLSITKGTASEAVSALERKELVRKEADPNDGRALILRLTRKGRREAQQSAQWPEVVVQAVNALPAAEQGGFLRGLLGLIGVLQERGAIPTSRMCAECRFFRPNEYPGRDKQHHCAYLEAPIADSELRIDCAEMEPAEVEVRSLLMGALFAGTKLPPETN